MDQRPRTMSPEPTHDALDLDALWDLIDVVMEEATDGPVTPELLADVSRSEDVPLSHVIAAAGAHPGLGWATEMPVQVRVCVGGCQGWGALELVDALVSERDARTSDGRASFDLIGVGCVQACLQRPAVTSVGPMGAHVHPCVHPDDVSELVAAVCD